MGHFAPQGLHTASGIKRTDEVRGAVCRTGFKYFCCCV